MIRTAAADRRIYAAGGVRNAGDLAALKAMDVAGALLATALHEGALTAADLSRFMAQSPYRTPQKTAPA
ncbi:MAG: HisA/HisF-related TIM barrel protein [Chromatiales bacterium]